MWLVLNILYNNKLFLNIKWRIDRKYKNFQRAFRYLANSKLKLKKELTIKSPRPPSPSELTP